MKKLIFKSAKKKKRTVRCTYAKGKKKTYNTPWAFHLCLGHSHAQLPNLPQPQDRHFLKEVKRQRSENCKCYVICL